MAYTTIKKPSDYFNTKLYTGNDGTLAISGVGFQPDWTWIKCRSHGGSASFEHVLTDAVRGVNKTLVSNDTDAETTNNATGYLSVFGSDGFTVTGGDAVNGVGRTYASWNWLGANGTASNTDGSVTSTVSANTTSGFSICKFTNPSSAINFTFGHGLGVAPKMFIMKGLNTSNWQVYNESVGNTYNTQLNYDNASTSAANWWGSTSPTSTVCTVGADLVETSQDSIAYCFAEVKGFSKFGTYTGNGSTDGTFIYTGFKPAFFICKRTSDIDDWFVFDNKRQGYNLSNNELRPNTNVAEGTTQDRIDILSNGIKHRQGGSAQNRSGDTYMYMAFAEEPLVGDNPATAR